MLSLLQKGCVKKVSSFIILLSLYKKEMYNTLKSPYIYVCTLIVAFFVWNTCSQVFNVIYETREEYEQKYLGYLTYEHFQSTSEEEFLKDYWAASNYREKSVSFRIYEDYMTMEERASLLSINKNNKNNKKAYEEIYTSYCESGKVIDYGYMTYSDIKLLPKDSYERICHSLYVPYYSGNFQYFIYSSYPTYEQFNQLKSLENLSSIIAREYFARMMLIVGIIGILLMINIFYKDNDNVLSNVRTTPIRSYQYINAKYLAINTLTILPLFVLTMITVIVFNPMYENISWGFYLSDFIKYFVLFPFVSICFLNALAMLIVVVTRDFIFSVSSAFYYIFLMSQPKYLEDGTTTFVIANLKFYPRIDKFIGMITAVWKDLIIHQISYMIITIFIVIITIFIWERRRTQRS